MDTYEIDVHGRQAILKHQSKDGKKIWGVDVVNVEKWERYYKELWFNPDDAVDGFIDIAVTHLTLEELEFAQKHLGMCDKSNRCR